MTYTFMVTADLRNKRQPRQAKMSVCYLHTGVQRPANLGKDYPAYLDLCVVEARECSQSVPPGQEPMHWLLLTNIKVANFDMALAIIQWHRWRWLIQQLFRILKSAGLDMENCGLNTIEEIQKLGIMALPAALQVLQLTYSEQSDQIQVSSVMETEKVDFLQYFNPTLEGPTARQKKPHPARSMA
ncbi:MAG TPA: hypothetical protein PK715_09780 [Chitinophagales bacterium]|nr:hypothetical protein [Chitinophagales bacterium]